MSTYEGIQEILENCAYLTALNEEKNASTLIIDNLPPHHDPKVQSIEDKMRKKGALNFDTIFDEATGFHLFKTYLSQAGHGPEKAIFLKDVDAYNRMSIEDARVKVAKMIFDRFMTERGLKLPPVGVFEAMNLRNRQRKKSIQNDEKSILKGVATRPSKAEDEGPSIKAEGSISGTEDTNHLDAKEFKYGDDEILSNQSAQNPNEGTQVKNLQSRVDYLYQTSGSSSHQRRSASQVKGSRSHSDVSQKGSENRIKKNDKKRMSEMKSLNIDDDDINNPLEIPYRLSKIVKQKIDRGNAPRDLFRDIEREVRNFLIQEAYPTFLDSLFYQNYIRTKIAEEAHVGVEDFQAMKPLGRGGFGTVFACKKIDSGKLYAMKQISKKLIKYKKAVSMTMLERHTLSLVQSSFVCGLAYAFQDKHYLYLVMDLMAGGDLKYHLTRSRTSSTTGFSEERARFHAAEILLGLEAMHKKNIIFRDLKLENVLLTEDGHCRLSDLGLVALYGKKKVTHYAGTPGYIAPEVTKKLPYGPAVDFFSFGVTLYRMLSGKKPFKGQSRQDFDRAVCRDEPYFDQKVFSPHAISIIKGLLRKDPDKRLGSGSGGVQAIKDHAFFVGIDWGLLEIGYLDPPFVPSKHDVNANSIDNLGMEEELRKYDKVVLDDKFRKQVHGFNYVSRRAVRSEIVSSLIEIDRREKEKERGDGNIASPTGCHCCSIQ